MTTIVLVYNGLHAGEDVAVGFGPTPNDNGENAIVFKRLVLFLDLLHYNILNLGRTECPLDSAEIGVSGVLGVLGVYGLVMQIPLVLQHGVLGVGVLRDVAY